MQPISQTNFALDGYSDLSLKDKLDTVYLFAIDFFNQTVEPSYDREPSIDKELKWLKHEMLYLKRWFAHQDKMATIRSIVKTLETHEFPRYNSQSDNELYSYDDDDIDTCEDTCEDKEDDMFHSPTHSHSSVSPEILSPMNQSPSDYPTSSSSSSSTDRLASLLESYRSDPSQVFVIAAKNLDNESNPETRRVALKYLQSAIDDHSIKAWSISVAQDTHPRIARITSALYIARAYTDGELREDNQQSTDERIEHYYKIALEKYGRADGDYLGISYYNRACFLEQRIAEARNRGVPPSELRKLYQEFYKTYDGCLRGNQPIERTSEMLYSVADMYYQIIQLSDELRIKKEGVSIAVCKAFKLCLEALTAKCSNERTLRKTLQSLTSARMCQFDEHQIKTLILLGHLLTQDYFIPSLGREGHSAGYFTDLDRERECGFWSYFAALANLDKDRTDYLDALCWGVEACALMENKQHGRALVSNLFKRISNISDRLSTDHKEVLLEDLKKLGSNQALLAKLRLKR